MTKFSLNPEEFKQFGGSNNIIQFLSTKSIKVEYKDIPNLKLPNLRVITKFENFVFSIAHPDKYDGVAIEQVALDFEDYKEIRFSENVSV